MRSIARKLDKKIAPTWLLPFTDKQSVFFGSYFDLFLNEKWFKRDCRYASAYFHGKPGQGIAEFDTCYENLKKYHNHIWRLQVSNKAMYDVVISSGIAAKKIFLIPIGINLNYFTPQTEVLKKQARRKYMVPENAIVIGSFQKDGIGWEEGMIPKWPKGPEVFIRTIALLKENISNLFVLLSGPARGFVKEGLKKLGVPYQHCFVRQYPKIIELYHCLDLYIVASREEGGPKAVLESMASRVPLVTTRVGQAQDMVHHGKNGWMVDVDDAEGLASWALHCLKHREERERIVDNGLITAKQNTYEAQLPLWANFFKGFVN